ncbi:MAG TPA: hypothetical protein VGO00_30155 [Kofleriaceae bacterium]|nr:hypothetical protein [Kofleriaceae bacterium]
MRALVVTMLLSTLACRGQAGDAPCGVAAGTFFTIAKGELDKATVDDATRRAVSEQLPAMRDSLENACRDDGWSAAVRNCLARCTDHVAVEECERQLTEPQRAGLDRAARGDSRSP